MLDFFIMRNAMCHCEEQNRGYIVKAMKRFFCLGQKRCADGAMCAFGTLRIYLNFGVSRNITLATAKISL